MPDEKTQPESTAQKVAHAFGTAIHTAENGLEAAVDRVKTMIDKIMHDDPAEVAAVEHEVREVAEAGLVAAEPAIEAVANSAVAAGVQAVAAPIEAAAPVLAPAVEAAAVATDKAADGVIESEFAHLAKALSHAPPQEAK